MISIRHRRLGVLCTLFLIAFAARDSSAQNDVIRNLQVKATDRNVVFGFTSFRNVVPLIEIGSEAPVFV